MTEFQPTIFECHVTIEPVFEERFDRFQRIAEKYNFKPAELLMVKNRKPTEIRSNKDTFCTGHSRSYDDLFMRMEKLEGELKEQGFQVWRTKIEGIVYDKKYERLFKIAGAE